MTTNPQERDIQAALRWEVTTSFNTDHGVTIYTICLTFGNYRAQRDFYPIRKDAGWDEWGAFSEALWMQKGALGENL